MHATLRSLLSRTLIPTSSSIGEDALARLCSTAHCNLTYFLASFLKTQRFYHPSSWSYCHKDPPPYRETHKEKGRQTFTLPS